MDKLDKKIREVEEQYADEVVQEKLDRYRKTTESNALVLLGGIRATERIAAALSSECMRSLIRFQEEKMHEALGYQTFVQFLSESEYAPMTKQQFYDRKALLEKEGDIVFDLLNDLSFSVRRRKLLGKGNVEFDGVKVIVHDGDEAAEIDITDRARLLETLTALADANADKTSKLEKQKQKIDKHEDEKRGFYDEIDRIKAAKAAEIGKDPHSVALANVCFAFAALREEIAGLTVVDCEARCANTLEILAGQMELTSRAYGGSGDWASEVAGSGDEAGQARDLLQLLDDMDLDKTPGDNDSELAASM